MNEWKLCQTPFFGLIFPANNGDDVGEIDCAVEFDRYRRREDDYFGWLREVKQQSHKWPMVRPANEVTPIFDPV